MKNWAQSRWMILLLAVLTVIIAPVIYFSEGSFQLGDTYYHYYIAKWALRYPHLLLDHWGKPVFTALYALPAQLGYTGAKFFSLFIGLVACWFTFKASRELKHSHPIPAVFFLLGSPIYFIHLNSTMTETLFSLFIIVGVLLLLREKFIWSAIIFSLLPLVRSEGFVLVPIFGFWFLFRKQWNGFLLLGTGTLIYGLLGLFFYYHDFFWLLNANPYAWKSTYGSGEIWHFANSYKMIFGIPFTILLCMGIIVHMINLKKVSRAGQDFNREFFLVLVPAMAFFIFHTVAWWTGRMASAGEIRVMVSVMPLFALVANRGLGRMLSLVRLPNVVKLSLIAAACIYLFAIPFFTFDLPLKRARDHELVFRGCEFIRENLPGKKVWFIDPLVPVELNLDGFGKKEAQQWFPHPANPELDVQPGELVLWDGHFCPREGKTNLTSFRATPYFKTRAHFTPDKPFTVFGNNYEIFIFERTEVPVHNTIEKN